MNTYKTRMTEKILLSCIVFTVSYCTSLGQEIKWSAIGSTDKLECSYPQYIKSNRTVCFWRFRKCTEGSCWYGRIQEDTRVKINDNQRMGIFDLQISNVSMDDQGDYWCECSYKVHFYSIAYRLKIKGLPRFLEKDENNTLLLTEGNNITLTCVLERGLPREQLLLTSDGLSVAYGGPENLNYTFIPSRADHLADYICIAKISQLVDRVTLYIRHIPDPPTNVSSHTCTSISVSWTPGANGNLPQVFFIEYKKVKSKLWERIGPINQISITEMTYKISVVSFDTLYEIRIFAVNDIGRSIYSSVVRTIDFVIKSINEDSVASQPFVPIQHWLVLGAVTVSLVLICILSHVCKYCGIKNPVGAANNRQQGTFNEEIGSVQYHFTCVAPVVPAPRQDNVQVNFTNEIENENNLRGSFDNAEPGAGLPGIGNDQTTSGRCNGEVVNVRNLPNDNLEPEFHNHSSEEHTVNAENHENPYTPLRQDALEEHHHNQCRNSGVFQERSTQNIVDYNDYINLML